jgi:hypothetical protein
MINNKPIINKSETNSPKAKPSTSRTSNLLPRSVIESMRKQAKIDHQRGLEILAKQAKAK